ncbi:hypothetical protein Tco_0447679, partial [Tanacetum coccineum]
FVARVCRLYVTYGPFELLDKVVWDDSILSLADYNHPIGKHNTLADSLSRLVNLCFAGCIGEMKELAAAALYSVEEVLQSPYTF